jgi:hypothetical protein
MASRSQVAGVAHYFGHHSSFAILMSRPFASSRLRAIAVAALVLLGASVNFACDDDSPTAPSEGALVTFRVENETFRVHLTTDEQIRGAELALGNGPAKIPNGRIVAGEEVNEGFSWHLVDVTFAEVTIEVCDGLPSEVQRAGVNFGGGRYCPWSARVVSIDYAR